MIADMDDTHKEHRKNRISNRGIAPPIRSAPSNDRADHVLNNDLQNVLMDGAVLFQGKSSRRRVVRNKD